MPYCPGCFEKHTQNDCWCDKCQKFIDQHNNFLKKCRNEFVRFERFDMKTNELVLIPETYGDLAEGTFEYQLTRDFDVDFCESAAQQAKIETIKDAKIALSWALQARIKEKEVDKRRSEMIKEAMKFQKNINSIAGKIKDKLKATECFIKIKLDEWIDSQKDNPFGVVEKLDVDEGTITVKKSFDFIIEDDRLVPDEYKTVDAALIEKAIKFGSRNIPGVKIYEKSETMLRLKSGAQNES